MTGEDLRAMGDYAFARAWEQMPTAEKLAMPDHATFFERYKNFTPYVDRTIASLERINGSAADARTKPGTQLPMFEDFGQARIEEVIDFADPVPTAWAIVRAKYIIDGQRILHFWQGEFHLWTGSHYAGMPLPDVREMLYRVGAASSRGGPVKKRHVDDVLDALRAVANLSNNVPSPAWITREADDPDPRAVIPMVNGILDTEENTLLRASPRLFASYALPFSYDPSTRTPTQWLTFLHELCGDDDESIALVQEWFGYSLTPRTEMQKAFMHVGPKRGGKGTIGRILTALLGKHNVVSPTLASLGTSFGLQPLIGKLLALISDARLGGKADLYAVAENVLRVTGEDQVSIPRKFLSDYTATLPVRIMVITNQTPRFTDGSGALPSRFVVLKTTASFYGREDHDLTRKLLAELPAILNWSLAGLRRLLDRGHFVQPAAASDVVEEMELLAAPVKAFLAERCDTDDPAAEVEVEQLYKAWCSWCEANGREHPGTQQTFGRDLRAALPALRTRQPRIDGGRERRYAGIRIRMV
jgi:putative DNA primase/helicase